jgi:Prealbumin-like fold domain
MSSSSRIKRSWLAPLSVVALIAAVAFPATSFADNSSGCDFAANGTTESCLPPLTGSTFAGADGNLLTSPTTFGTTDWQNAPAQFSAGIDKPSGSGDNAFGQGTKEDSPNVSVVSGSIPPNKSDLTRFYEASEQGSNGHTFLYLAWERTNTLGSANMDFEINKLAQPDLTTTGAKTLNRSPGDLLITFDFTNGGGRPTLGLNRWLVSATNPVVPGFPNPPGNVCLSSNTFPCWGDHVTLTGSVAIGAVNNLDTVTDPVAPNAPRDIAANRFGEAEIDLTNSGVFGTGTCTTFASTFLKSRASASFPAEVKDFVAPVPTTISNCGTLIVKKVTVPSPDPTNTSFAFSVDGANPPNTNLPKTFSLKDGESNSTQVFAGTGFSAEETVPANWVLTSATCDNGSGTLSGGKISGISVDVDETVTCTFTNTLQQGAIQISKTDSKTGNALAGATFSIKSGGTPITGSPFTTDSNGKICVDGLAFGDYSVQEVSAPTGYVIDDSAPRTVTVDNSAKCSDATYVGESTSFSDTPTADIQVRFRDGGSGVTSGTISCDNTTGTTSTTGTTGWDDTTTVTGIHAPTTVTCTIVIDP